MYVTICKIDDQCKVVARSRALKAVLWDSPEGRGGEGGRKRIRGERGIHVYLWPIHVNAWQINIILQLIEKICMHEIKEEYGLALL